MKMNFMILTIWRMKEQGREQETIKFLFFSTDKFCIFFARNRKKDTHTHIATKLVTVYNDCICLKLFGTVCEVLY